MKYVMIALIVTCAIAFASVHANRTTGDATLPELAQKRVAAADQMVRYLEQR